MSIATDHRNAPIAFWRVASHLMRTLFNLFGAPEALAFLHTLGARDYRLACNWLRSVEALFRRLLFIEASYHVGAVTPSKQCAKRKRVRREMVFFPDKPDEWRVAFHVFKAPAIEGGSAALRRACVAERRAPARFHSAWPLAERFEALLRVHNDPTPFAKRLARRLSAESVPNILKAPPELQHRIDPEPYAEIDVLCAERRRLLSRGVRQDSS